MTARQVRLHSAAAREASYRRLCRMRTMSRLELRALLAGDAEAVAPWIASAAEHGAAWAQLRLGQIRLDGIGGPADPAMALVWFSRAAAQGLGEAMNMVGRCHENGWGTAVDLAEAADWYGRSARAGHDWGQYNYGNMYLDGLGVARDQIQAAIWYRRAAEQGHTRAMNLLARCCEEGWGLAPDPRQAADWYRRSAEGGYFRGQFNHASVLASFGGIGDAGAWFQRALAGAPPPAREALAQTLSGHPDPELAAIGLAELERGSVGAP